MSNPLYDAEVHGHTGEPQSVYVANDYGPWRDGDALVCAAQSSQPWPAKCVKCGESTDVPPQRFKLFYRSPWVSLLIVLSLFLVLLFDRPPGYAMISLCRKCTGWRWAGKGMIAASLLWIAAIVLLAAAFKMIAITVLALPAIVPLLIGLRLQRGMAVTGGNELGFSINGVHYDLLAVLPSWRGVPP